MILLFVGSLQGQAYIKHSRVIGGSGNQSIADLIVNGGHSYILGTTLANDHPITLGGVPTGTTTKSTLTRLDASGNIVWSRYLPFSASGTLPIPYGKMILSNGVIYLTGSTSSTDVPVTDGSVHHGGGDVLFTKVDAASGDILFNTYMGGSGNDGSAALAVESGYVYITYTTTSSNIPTTTGPTYTAASDHVVQKLDAFGNIVYSTYTGQAQTSGIEAAFVSITVENSLVYLAFSVGNTNNFVTTDGSTAIGGNDIGLLRLDANGNKTLAKILGGTGLESNPALAVNNGEIYLAARTASTNYPVTDGSSRGSLANSVVLSRFNSSGNLVFSGYRVGMPATLFPINLQYKNGSIFIAVAAQSSSPELTTTDVSTGGNALIRINATNGTVQFATKFGEIRGSTTSNPFVDMFIDDNAIYTTSPIQNSGAPSGGAVVTDGSTRTSRSGAFITKHTVNGQLLHASFLTSRNSPNGLGDVFSVAFENDHLYISGAAVSGFPVTASSLGPTPNTFETDPTWAVLEFCPPIPTINTIIPLSQAICENGLAQTITGNEATSPSSQVPVVYINGAPTEQTEIRPRYQWQSSTSATGPWTNISTGTQRDYLPPAAAQTLYYRRLVLPPAGCGETPVSISSVAEVAINAGASPTVTSNIFTTCTNTAVDINVTVSGGTAPYTYAWDNGIGSTSNTATVTPTANSVYTVTVTDANGCQQIGQVIVNAFAADAGPATASVCAGRAVRIGTPPPAGLAGVAWSWTPVTGLDDPTAAQPLASPGSSTIYSVQMTIPVSGGGTCTTSDNITVNVDAGPATANFAGPDRAVCKGGGATLGTAAEAGFTYTWSPGNYLSNVTASTTTFNAGSNLPQPNQFVYTLTASRNGCTFTDQVSVAVLEVDAGEDYCGPRTVGTQDKMPGVTGKNWLWQVISGPGTITGASNTPITTVSASTGIPTTYRVTVTYLGVSCSDEVVVGNNCASGCPNLQIDVVADHGCPGRAFGPVTLRANPSDLSAAQWTYSWSSIPAGGLSATTGSSVTLTDNVERDVTVTITRTDNPSFTCSETIHVNDPLWALPAFNATDATICPGNSVAIGAPVAGYTFTWQNVNAGDENLSNPSVSPTTTASYPVEVTDVTSGCNTHDTATVTVKPVVVNPGPDWVACSNALITLGSPALPAYTYSWSPQVASYQNGTTYQSAQPQLLIATSQDYTLTVTDTESGCTADSTVHIIIDNSSSLPAMNDATICQGGSATIGLPAWPGVTYSWSPSTALSSTTVAQPIANPTSTQIYTLTVTFYDEGGAVACTRSGTVTVNVNAPLITMSDESICPSGALYNLSNGVTVSGATSYSWSPAILVTDSTALNTTVRQNPHSATTFTLTARDAGGCITSASKVISPINAAPEAGSTGFVCVGDSRTLGASSNTGTLSWTVNSAITGTLAPANGAQPVFTPAAADAGTTLIFTITQDIGGCINTDSVMIQVRSLVLPSMPSQMVCMNAPATIGVAAQQGITYAWSPITGLSDPSAATATISSVTSNTVYTLTAVDGYGCSATATTAVGVSSTSAPTVNVPDVTVVVGTSGTPFAPQVSPMPGDYTYTWSPATRINNPYISNATALPGPVGTYNYNLAVTDDNGCTTVAPARLNVVPANIILPITLTYFKASVNGCGVRIQWKVESFEDFSHFVLERSGNGTQFREIGRLYHEPYRNIYAYDDVDPGNGKWIYRLKLVDKDGGFTYSTMSTAKMECAYNEKLSVYPNPIKDRIYIKSSKPVKNILLISTTGQVVEKYEFNQVQPGIIWMPVANKMTRGIYFMLIVATDGSVRNSKVLKE